MAKLKLNDELQAQICEKVAACASFRDACTLVDLDESTAFKWLKKGQAQKRGVYRRFFQAVENAKALRRTTLKAKIRVLGNKDWRALQALGAMTDPEEFVPQVRVIIARELDAVLDRIKVRFAETPDVYEAVLEAIAAGDVSPVDDGGRTDPSPATPAGAPE